MLDRETFFEILDSLNSAYRKAYESENKQHCEKLMEIFRGIGVAPKEDKLDTINRMKGKKQSSIM